MKLDKSSLLILVPAFNEEKNIEKVMDDIDTHCPGVDYLIINDGSTDQTLEICKRRKASVLNLSINLGLAGAFQAGMRYAVKNKYKYAIQFDGDGQHCAKYIPIMLEEAEKKKCNIVIASRYIRGTKGRSFREIGSRLISFCIFITTGQRVTDPTSGMRLYDNTVMERIARHINYSPEPDTIAALLRSGAVVEEIPADMRERIYGSSYLTFGKSIQYMFHICMSILVVNWLR